MYAFLLVLALQCPVDTVSQEFMDTLIVNLHPILAHEELDSVPDCAKDVMALYGVSDSAGIRFYIRTNDDKCHLFWYRYVTEEMLENMKTTVISNPLWARWPVLNFNKPGYPWRSCWPVVGR